MGEREGRRDVGVGEEEGGRNGRGMSLQNSGGERGACRIGTIYFPYSLPSQDGGVCMQGN